MTEGNGALVLGCARMAFSRWMALSEALKTPGRAQTSARGAWGRASSDAFALDVSISGPGRGTPAPRPRPPDGNRTESGSEPRAQTHDSQ